jgi:hypothetical protein
VDEARQREPGGRLSVATLPEILRATSPSPVAITTDPTPENPLNKLLAQLTQIKWALLVIAGALLVHLVLQIAVTNWSVGR